MALGAVSINKERLVRLVLAIRAPLVAVDAVDDGDHILYSLLLTGVDSMFFGPLALFLGLQRLEPWLGHLLLS